MPEETASALINQRELLLYVFKFIVIAAATAYRNRDMLFGPDQRAAKLLIVDPRVLGC